MHQVISGNDTAESEVLEDSEVPHMVTLHQLHALLDGSIGCGNGQGAAHELAHRYGVQRPVLEKYAAGNIVIGDDTLEFVVFQNDQKIYIFGEHLVERIAQQAIGNDGIELGIFPGQYISDSVHEDWFIRLGNR